MVTNSAPPPAWLLYLYSRKNIVACLLALLGLVLFFIGLIGWPLWVGVVLGMYLIGALVTPSGRTDLLGGEAPSDLAGMLNHEVAAVKGKVPDDVFQKVLSIQSTVEGILPKIDRLGPGSQDSFVVQKTVTDYLPSTLQSYLNLPRAYATLHRLSDGRTASQLLLDQLTLLDKKLDDVADAVNKNDTDALMANGRFLEDKFGGSSSLNLPSPASS